MGYDFSDSSAQTALFTEWLEDASSRNWLELARRPLLAVLDTSCVRTGLHYQLRNGEPPASITTVQDGTVKLFMAYDTLAEICEKLPKFARDLNVPVSELQRMLNEDWLPYIRVVKLPEHLRELDPRALGVRELDIDDYAAAALAALLSPCILLTHNHRHFAPLGVRTPSQGVTAIIAAIDIRVGETHVQVVGMIPAAPVYAVVGTTKWASERIGPAAWAILGLFIVGSVYLYRQQPPERRERIREVAKVAGKVLLEQAAEASRELNEARTLLRASAVRGPERRTPAAAVFRELAFADESLSAQLLAARLDNEVRPSVPRLRAFLHGHEETAFAEVRRGGFVLGRHYVINSAD